MAGTIFGLPFDEELFMDMWSEAPDPVLTAMIESGAVAEDPQIAEQIQGKGNLYTIPFYNPLEGEEQNYDGRTDIVPVEIDGTSQTGIVYGRAKAFKARNFTAELSGGDPMGHIARSVARYWQKVRQANMIRVANAVFGVTGATKSNAKAWHDGHIMTLETDITVTSMAELAQKACGDHSGMFGMAIMHSAKATSLAKEGLLNFRKYTDPQGIERQLNIADINGYTVIVDDGVPVDYSSTAPKYTTYLFGTGVIRTAKGRVDVPVEAVRQALENGGQDVLVTRMRETLHPNGFSFNIPAEGWTDSPTNAQLEATANWDIKLNQKSIPMAKLVTL